MHLGRTLNKIAMENNLFERGQFPMALAMLQAKIEKGVFESDEQWFIDRCIWRIYSELGDLETAARYAWKSITNKEGQSFRNQQQHFSDYLFLLHYLPQVTDRMMRDYHFMYDQFARAEGQCHHSQGRHRHERIRVGYLSNTFRGSVITIFCWPLIVGYDRSRFEVYCYTMEDQKGNATLEAIRGQVKRLRSYKWGGMRAETVKDIYDDEIDILVDLNVHCSGGCTAAVMCHRPAPVQMAGIGYMATSGTRAVDYFLGDRYCDTPEADGDFSERLLRLPSHFCYTPAERAKAVERNYRQTDHIRFATFNKVSKINEQVAAAWGEIMRRVPGSTLLIKSGESDNKYIRKSRQKMLVAAGIPAENITFEGATADFLQRYMDVDIQLDTFPYCGGATTADSLYMGVPVVTRYGHRHGTRFGYSMLMNIGLGELAAPDTEGYIDRAVALAQDRTLLQALHERLPDMMRQSPLMDSCGYVRQLESIYEDIWQHWLDSPAEQDYFPDFHGALDKGKKLDTTNMIYKISK